MNATRTTKMEPFTPKPVTPDSDIYPMPAGNTDSNEFYSALNGYHLLEAAERSLCERIDAKGIEACPATLQADLLQLNQLEQINLGTGRVAGFVDNLEMEVVRELKVTNAKLQELIDGQKALIEVLKLLATSKA